MNTLPPDTANFTAALLARKVAWRKLANRQPHFGQLVLFVYTAAQGIRCRACGHLDRDSTFHLLSPSSLTIPRDVVTHWLPVPPLPPQ